MLDYVSALPHGEAHTVHNPRNNCFTVGREGASAFATAHGKMKSKAGLAIAALQAFFATHAPVVLVLFHVCRSVLQMHGVINQSRISREQIKHTCVAVFTQDAAAIHSVGTPPQVTFKHVVNTPKRKGSPKINGERHLLKSAAARIACNASS